MVTGLPSLVTTVVLSSWFLPSNIFGNGPRLSQRGPRLLWHCPFADTAEEQIFMVKTLCAPIDFSILGVKLGQGLAYHCVALVRSKRHAAMLELYGDRTGGLAEVRCRRLLDERGGSVDLYADERDSFGYLFEFDDENFILAESDVSVPVTKRECHNLSSLSSRLFWLFPQCLFSSLVL
jgi:hypothetical protein